MEDSKKHQLSDAQLHVPDSRGDAEASQSKLRKGKEAKTANPAKARERSEQPPTRRNVKS